MESGIMVAYVCPGERALHAQLLARALASAAVRWNLIMKTPTFQVWRGASERNATISSRQRSLRTRSQSLFTI